MSELREHPRICDRHLIAPGTSIVLVSRYDISLVAVRTESTIAYLRSVSFRGKHLEQREHLKGLTF